MTTLEKKIKDEQSTFLKYASYQKLSKLAEKPFNLSELSPQRIQNYCGESCGFKLLYGTERVDDEVLKALESLATEAQVHEKMRRMQAGEIVNYIENFPSEKRAALHTATRDFFDEPMPSEQAKHATSLAKKEIEKLKSFLSKIDQQNKFNEMIMIGIGGSDLGPRANYYALQHLQKKDRKIHFISNVDPDDAALVLGQANLKKSLIVIVSKSGKTLETAVNEDFAKKKLIELGLNPKEHMVSITSQGSPMDNPNKYLEAFYIWDWIGGRYSTTSMVGGVVLSFAFGFDVFWEFLRGAHDMDRTALQKDVKKNIPLLAALLGIWNRNFLKLPTVAMIPYSQALSLFPAHIQQVSMESNGKMIDQYGEFVHFETGPVIWGAAGTNAQHSFFQLIHQGTSTVPVSMVGFAESQCGEDIEVGGTTSQQKLIANFLAQSIALALGQKSDNPNTTFPGNRPTHILMGKKLTPRALGSLLAFYEHLVVFQGFIWGINSFDQEGVQLGKVLANKIIDCFKTKKWESYPLGEAFYKHLSN